MQRLGAVLTAALIAFGGVVVLPAAAAGAAENDGSDVSIIRFGGADRYETSLQVAEAVAADAGGSLEWVVLVSGRRWTDAVVAAPLAGALGAPVLMTPPDELRADALEFLQRVGVSSAVVVGPDASGGAHGPGRGVGAGVLEALDEAGISVERVAGEDRFGTGVAAAARVTPGAMGELGRTAVIASSEVFADALVAGPFAARGIHPVLLTPPDELHADVSGYLGEAGISHIVLMGGTAALSESVEQSVEDLGIDVSRVAGSTRYDTAVKAAELVDGRYSDTAGQTCFDDSALGLARARVPFDSFSAAPLLGRLCAPLVLADPAQIPPDTATYLDAAREANPSVDLRVFGGDAAVSQAAIDAYISGEDAAEPEEAEGEDDEAEGETETEDEPNVLPAGTCGGAIDDEPVQLVPSTNAEDPAWSPDCSRLVYTENGSLWTVSNDGTDARKLLDHGGAYLHSPVWSHDGTRIAYVRDRNHENGHWSSHIWTVNVDGSHNNQRTEGDQIDLWPAWSPDDSKIAFERLIGSGHDEHGILLDSDRHIVVMTSFGNDPKALNEGGRWEQSPAWSPDGSQLAYQTDGFVVVADTDGGNERRVHAAVYFADGLSWSPDGARIAFTRGDGSQSSIVIAGIDGLNEEVVFDEGLRTLAPRWSPDGQRIAFHTIDDEGRHRAYVVGASGEAATATATDCRPRGGRGTTAGFPLDDWAAPSVGTLRIAALFLDFPDAQAKHTTQDEAAQGLPYVEDYLEAVSYGQLDVEFVSDHAWLRAENDFSTFSSVNALGNQAVDSSAVAHAIELAGQNMDFSGIDAVMVILPSSLFGGGGFANPHINALDESWPSTLVNSVHLGDERVPNQWGSVAAHEVTHNLGLADLYPYDSNRHARAEAPAGMAWVAAEWGRMNMWSWYLAAEHDTRMSHVWTYPDGLTATSYSRHLRIEEMLAWSRWQLGWLSESQVRCSDADEATVTLSPIAQPGDAVVMAAIPLSAHEVIVMESRRRLGYDAGRHYEAADTGATTTFPRLITEGVLVYTVDSWLGTGALPLRVAGDSGNGQVDDFPVLEAGESVTLRGYTITVVADDNDTHTVTITRNF